MCDDYTAQWRIWGINLDLSQKSNMLFFFFSCYTSEKKLNKLLLIVLFKQIVCIVNILVFSKQAILPIEQSIPRSTYIHPPAVNAAKGAF